MTKIKFKSTDGNIICDLTVKKSNLTKKGLEALFIPLMLHMDLCINLSDSYLYKNIQNIRSTFYTDVLKFLIISNQEHGNEIPKEITDFMTKENKSINWYQDD